jgi:outer membrane lipoprotein SlyB
MLPAPRLLAAFALACALGIPTARAQGTAAACDNCGRVLSIKPIVDQTTSWQPLGTVSPGSVAGDPTMVGRTTTAFQVGGGGKDPGMVMLGAAGGAAYARRPDRYQRTRWEVSVRMDDGTPRVVSVDYEPLFQEGDRVQVSGRQVDLL